MREWLSANGIYYANIAGGAFAKPGDPDIIADVDGHFLAIEAKTKTGRQSPQQKICQAKVEASGGVYIVARSLQDVITAVETIRKTI
jgi:Holliday junction resolvase